MGELYLPLKWLHVVSATILFGTGLGTAFHFWHARRGGNVAAIAASARSTVLADFAFTRPGAEFRALERRWFALGWPAFLALLAVFWLMVARPA